MFIARLGTRQAPHDLCDQERGAAARIQKWGSSRGRLSKQDCSIMLTRGLCTIRYARYISTTPYVPYMYRLPNLCLQPLPLVRFKLKPFPLIGQQ